jgi:hypothetical protein
MNREKLICNTNRIAVLWLLDGSTASVEIEAFGCAQDPDSTAAEYIASVTGLKVTVQTMQQTTAEAPK